MKYLFSALITVTSFVGFQANADTASTTKMKIYQCFASYASSVSNSSELKSAYLINAKDAATAATSIQLLVATESLKQSGNSIFPNSFNLKAVEYVDVTCEQFVLKDGVFLPAN